VLLEGIDEGGALDLEWVGSADMAGIEMDCSMVSLFVVVHTMGTDPLRFDYYL